MLALPVSLAVSLLAAGTPASGSAAGASARTEAAIRADLAFLSDDLLEGRGTGQRGGDLAVAYLEARLAGMGLAPLGTGARGYRQEAEVIGARLRVAESALRFHGRAGDLAPALGEDVVAGTGAGLALVHLEAGVVFAGFGIAAPEEGWDDWKGEDVRGKVVVLLANEPPPTADEPARFGGADLTLYGRWTWKYEEAARRGAAGVLLVHTDESASYGWSVVQTGFRGEKFQLAGGPPLAPLQGWITEAFARRLLAAGGADLDALRARARSRDFRPVPLSLVASVSLASDVRRFRQANVAAVRRGTDPRLGREAVISSAHWDHFGVQDGKIFNGAVDNASGCAAVLALARAAADAPPTPRSQVFLFTFGEEQGLLGSRAWVADPPWPLADTVAVLNLESLNWVGRSRDLEFLGGGRSTLLPLARAAARATGLVLRKDDPDTAGLYFRSDHFPFARAGVPAVSPGFSLAGQREYVDAPEASRARARQFLDRYHKESDDYDPAWDLAGMLQQVEFVRVLGRSIAGPTPRPVFLPAARPASR